MKNYVTEFDGQPVPTGSKYYSKADINQKSYFYNNERWPIGDKSAFVISYGDLKELPEAKWEPVVGEYYLVKHAGTFVNCFYIGKDIDGRFAYQVTEGKDVYELDSTDLSSNFKPLKSAEEIARDAFNSAVIDALLPIHNEDFNIDEIAGALFHADFTAPKALNEQ
jgi:hypothetical protein